MANRKTRKDRFQGKNVLTFKQKVQMGVARGQLIRQEINYNQVPQWMRDVWGLPSDEQLVSQIEETALGETDEHVHVHGENCTHHE